MNKFFQCINDHMENSRKKKQSLLLIGFLVFSNFVFAQNNPADSADDTALNQHVGNAGDAAIVFDSSNIKQFWIDHSCVSRNESIEILLEQSIQAHESVPLNIRLVNVNETQDCRVEVIAETKDFSFSVLDSKIKAISKSKKEDDLQKYSVASAVFHLEDTANLSFYIKFASNTEPVLSVRKIILTFSPNKESSFLLSPGKISITDKTLKTSAKISNNTETSFSVTGKRSAVFSTKKILTADNTLSCSVKVKNTGSNSTQVCIGYATYTKEQILLWGSNYPYQNNNKILNVVSCSDGNDKIIVDSYTDWAKNCYLALDAKEDMSDVPNIDFAGRIAEIKKLENGHAEITLNAPLKNPLAKGTKVRVHGQGGGYIYMNSKVLQPNEEAQFSSTIKKDDSCLKYTNQAFSRGVYYVVPLILSYSVKTGEENTVLISDYTVSY